MTKATEVNISVIWPAEAIEQDWHIAEVVAIDGNGVQYLLQIVAVTRPIALQPREKH